MAERSSKVRRPDKGIDRRKLQDMRLREVQQLPMDRWQELCDRMRTASNLPKLQAHFKLHGAEFTGLGVTTPQHMQELFLEHIRRTDLELFTYISTQKGTRYRHWVLVGMDNGMVALYNETKRRHWTFMRPPRFQDYLRGNRGLWVKVEDLGNRLEVDRW